MIKKLLSLFKPKPAPNNDIILLRRIVELDATLNFTLTQLEECKRIISEQNLLLAIHKGASSPFPVSKRKRGRPSKKTQKPNTALPINQPVDIKDANA